MTYEITLRDRTIELVSDADAFSHDKTMTTFYRTANSRRTIDCWSTPLASIRTDEILMIREAVSRAVSASLSTAASDAVDATYRDGEVATVHQLKGA